MTQKEAIKHLDGIKGMFDYLVSLDGGVATDEDYEAFDMALDALRRTAWIPVEDALPNPDDDVLVMLASGAMAVDCTWEYESGLIIWEDHDDNVIAWRHLPEPYVEVQE